MFTEEQKEQFAQIALQEAEKEMVYYKQLKAIHDAARIKIKPRDIV